MIQLYKISKKYISKSQLSQEYFKNGQMIKNVYYIKYNRRFFYDKQKAFIHNNSLQK